MKSKTPFMTLLALVGVIVFVSGCSNSSVPGSIDQWVEHKEGNLKCKLPNKPKMQSQNINHPLLGKLTFKIFLCEVSKESGLMVSQVTYPVPAASYDVQVGLDGAVEGMATNVNGKVLSKSNIKHKSLAGREVVVEAPDNLYAKARIYIDGKGPTLYQFQAIGNKSFLDQKVVKDFFDSVEITPLD